MADARFKYNQGRLYMGKTNLSMLLREFGSPLYVYDGNKVKENFLSLKKALESKFTDPRICYSVKANANLEILKLLAAEGAYADCSSAVEVFLAKKAGFDLSKCILTSVNPTHEDLEWAMKNKLIMNLDALSQLDKVLKMGRPHTISFRVNPQISAGKFEQIRVGGKGTKFGMSTEEVMQAYRKATRAGIMHFGIHMMAGSCVLDPEHFGKAAKKLLTIAAKISKDLGITFDFINIGGGLGIPYEPGEKNLDVKAMVKSLHTVFESMVDKIGTPTLVMEPGRFLVGNTGILLTTVTTIKETAADRFVGVDAGMSTLLRPALYGAYHNIMPLKQRTGRPQPHTIVGPVCENTDCFAKNRKFPKILEEDTLAILDVGAYGFAMASQYNGRLRPAEVLLENGKPRLIRRREEMKDILLG